MLHANKYDVLSETISEAKKEKINIVWFKRDLRLQDHLPLKNAEESNLRYLCIYIIDPVIMKHPDNSLRHQQFIYHSILDMNKKLDKYDKEVLIFQKETHIVFNYLSKKFSINNIFSYQESGTKLSWDIDKKVTKYCKAKDVNWIQYQRDGIIRGIRNRENWDKNWYRNMSEPIIKNTFIKHKKLDFKNPFAIENSLLIDLASYPKDFQPAGEDYANKYLNSFTESRGKNYSKFISKPMESRKSCGRISVYLAWGNISIKQAYQHIKNHSNYAQHKRSFNGILIRLKWHCHFIQKFEVECEYEYRCVNAGYEEVKYTDNSQYIEDWKKGNTGLPLVDASMRCLKQTGWLNFRMRAMLVSVLCHHFDSNWKHGVNHLANLFLDYEPGIHYTQFQMQAGTTGINTVRIYNPVKQSKDHDPYGIFIRKWIPELLEVPNNFIHEPWKMTAIDMTILNLELDYVKPKIDIIEAAKAARIKAWGHRKDSIVKREKKRIVKLHTRNNLAKRN